MTSFEPVDSGADGGESVEARNPAWQEFVGDATPEVYQQYLEPAFKKWDASVNQRFNQVQQQYEPWKDVIKNADPETAGFAINLLNALNNNPADVIQKVSEYYKLDQLQNRTSQGQPEPRVVPEEEPWKRELETLRRQSDIMAQALLQRHKEEEAAQADAQLNQELGELKQKYASKGDFNESWVSAMALQADISLEDAVKAYYEMADQIRRQAMPRPLISPGGGGSPGAGGLNVRKMNDNQTKNLIVDILNANNAQRNQ